jgi:hypothetical protein
MKNDAQTSPSELVKLVGTGFILPPCLKFTFPKILGSPFIELFSFRLLVKTLRIQQVIQSVIFIGSSELNLFTWNDNIQSFGS